ncbi:MAG: alginate export family protein [Myxococcales bacterium]|nr:alginate export family protein [Myxococcales bacterium]
MLRFSLLLALAPVGGPPPPPEPTAATAPDAGAAQPAATSPAPGAPAPTAAPAKPPPLSRHTFQLTPGLQYWVRGRGRYVASFNNDDPAPTHNLEQQVRVHVDASYGPVSAFIQFQDARAWGFERGPGSDESNTDLYQGYLQLAGARQGGALAGEVRVGRQEIVFGSRRLIAQRPWSLTGQSFDAIRVRAHYRDYAFDGFAALLRRPETFQSTDANGATVEIESPASALFGAELRAGFHRAFTVAAQVVGTHERPTPEAPTRTRDIVNGGLRITGEPIEGLRYDVEGFYQAGQQQGRDHRAWALFAFVDHDFVRVKTRPGLHAGYTIASGEACENDPADGPCQQSGRSREFYDFYRTRHGFVGIIDLALFRNIRDLELGARLVPVDKVELALTYHFLQLQEPAGRWWSVPEGLVGAGWDPDNTARNLGHELDLTLDARVLADHLTIRPGYAIFFPDAAGRTIGGGRDPQHFAYLWLVAQF